MSEGGIEVSGSRDASDRCEGDSVRHCTLKHVRGCFRTVGCELLRIKEAAVVAGNTLSQLAERVLQMRGNRLVGTFTISSSGVMRGFNAVLTSASVALLLRFTLRTGT